MAQSLAVAMRRAVVTVLAAACLSLSAPAEPASAHPTLLFTTPGADAAVTESPSSVVLVFNEPVSAGAGAVDVRDRANRPVRVRSVTTGRGGRAVVATLAGTLPTGVYVVRWRVTGADGDLVEDAFRFAVGAAIAGPGRAGPDGAPSWPAAALRWLLFVGLALALGALVGQRWTAQARAAVPELAAVRSWIPAGLVAGFAATVGLGVLFLAEQRAGLVTAASGLVRDRAGQVLVVEAVAFAVAGLLLAARQRWAAVVAVVGEAAAEGLRGHANVAQPGWGALLTGVHLTAAAVWVGALLHVGRAALAWRAQPRAVWWLLSQYARSALWLVLTVVATGTLTGLLLVAPSAITATPYGRILLVKLGLVVAAVALALAARLRLRRGHERVAAAAQAARVESLVLVVVLAVTGVLVSTPPPGDRRAGEVAVAPATVGPVLPLGTLAGQIGVGVTASSGQLVARLATPQVGDYYGQTTPQTYALSGRVVPAGGPAREVRFRDCGDGCFTGAAAWRTGENLLTLRASAPGWRGGTASLLVLWPPRPGADLLARAVVAMRRVDTLSVYEAVTSDASAPLPDPVPLRLNARTFLASEPYGSGVAPIAVSLPAGPGAPRLALGFPAERIYVRLLLDQQGRIQEETLTDAKHLIHRRFLYQGT